MAARDASFLGPARFWTCPCTCFWSDCSARSPQTHACGATRESIEACLTGRSASHLRRARRRTSELHVSLVVSQRLSTTPNAASNPSRLHRASRAPHKKSCSPQHLSSPTPRHNNKDALRPLGNSKTALRAAAAPARPRPRLARRVGTIGSASLEGGGQPRALHAAKR